MITVRHQEEVYDLVAEEMDIPKEQVMLVVTNYWKSVHFYLTNPLHTGNRIKLVGGFTMKIIPRKIGTMLGKADFAAEFGEYKREYQKARQYYLNKLSKQVKKFSKDERQTSRIIDNARYSSYRHDQKRRKRRENYFKKIADNSTK